MKKYYYTIGEVSRLLDLKQHVIRYWETEFPQLHPRKEKGRNRRYSEENIEILRKIKDMLYEQRYTIDGARLKLNQQQQNKKVEQLELEFDFQIPEPVTIQPNTPAAETLLRDLQTRLLSLQQEILFIRRKQTSPKPLTEDAEPEIF
jgi:DNA-binding transcriptional MerR regulator